jgi:hypothetical protein
MNKNVLKKLSKLESNVELSEVKVDLSLYDDFKTAMVNMIREPASDEVNKILALKKEVQKGIDNSKQILGRVNYVAKIGIQLEEATKQLGVDLPAEYGSTKDRLYAEEKKLKGYISDWTTALNNLVGSSAGILK